MIPGGSVTIPSRVLLNAPPDRGHRERRANTTDECGTDETAFNHQRYSHARVTSIPPQQSTLCSFPVGTTRLNTKTVPDRPSGALDCRSRTPRSAPVDVRISMSTDTRLSHRKRRLAEHMGTRTTAALLICTAAAAAEVGSEVTTANRQCSGHTGRGGPPAIERAAPHCSHAMQPTITRAAADAVIPHRRVHVAHAILSSTGNSRALFRAN